MAALRAFARLHLLVSKGVKPLEILQHASNTASNYVKGRLPALSNKLALQPAYARVAAQPIHPRAFLKQSRRWLSSSVVRSVLRELGSETSNGARRVSSSRIASSLSQSTGYSPFAHTLRPNLTGGALPRSAGGYGLGSGRLGGARYFSHAPQAPAQVVHNVSQAMRAFAVGGKQVQYDGTNPYTGEKRFRAVTALQDKTQMRITSLPKATPGSFIDYHVNPTITALAPMSSVSGFAPSHQSMETLNKDGLLDILSVDFARALQELLIILDDLKRLGSLGDLPITYEGSRLRVHFPGCDAHTVESLMEELGLRRGTVGQDTDFDAFVGTEIALLFPFAPSKTGSEKSFYNHPVEVRQTSSKPARRPVNPYIEDYYDALELPGSPILGNLPSPDFSTMSDTGLELFEEMGDEELGPWLSSSSGYETLRSSEVYDSGHPRRPGSPTAPMEYQGFKGLQRFIQLCDDAQRR